MRSSALLLLAVLAFAAGPSAFAGADDDAERAKAQIEYFEKYVAKVKDDGKYGDLVMELASTPHPLVVERVGKIVLSDRDEEHKLIAAAAMAEFKQPREVMEAAGKVLVAALQKEFSDDVTDTCIDSIGKIGYRDAVPVLNTVLLSGGDPYVLLTTVRVMGKLDDRRALPALLELWNRHPVGYSWETGEVKVDTGADGTTDQDAAEAAWQAKYGKKMGGKKKPPVMFKVYIQEVIRTVRKITREEKIEKPADLVAWMEAHREELAKEGIEVPKPKKKKDKDEKDGKGKDEKPKDDKSSGGEPKK